MPAILTHDFFGQDIYAAHSHVIGKSIDEKDAFLLGNQGPDPLFYLVLSPSMKQFFGLGSAMHHDAPSKLIAALKESLQVLEEHELPVGRAYALGFLCHYSLDRAMHPLVYCHNTPFATQASTGSTAARKTKSMLKSNENTTKWCCSANWGAPFAPTAPSKKRSTRASIPCKPLGKCTPSSR